MTQIMILSGLVLLVDQIIKGLVSKFLYFESITLIPHFFRLTYVQNDGAAWNILSGNRYLLVGIAVVAIVLVYYFMIHNKKLSWLEKIGYSLFIGGVLGNLWDRFWLGFVIDYLDFNIFGYNFPVFNLADIVIVISMILIVIQIIKGDKNEVSSKSK